MKLYRVDVSYSLFVRARIQAEARQLAKDAISTMDFDQQADECIAYEIVDTKYVPQEWRSAIPYSYGDSDDKTVAEILAEKGECDAKHN